MSFDLHTLKNLEEGIDKDIHILRSSEKYVDKHFGSKEAHIYYSDEIINTIPKADSLEKKELPGFSIIFSKNKDDPNKFIISGTDLSTFSFTDKYTPNDVVSMIKTLVIQNPLYFSNNHVSFFLNNPEQKKYLEAIKADSAVKEYIDKSI